MGSDQYGLVLDITLGVSLSLDSDVRVACEHRHGSQAAGPVQGSRDAYASLDAVVPGKVTNTPNNVHAIMACGKFGSP